MLHSLPQASIRTLLTNSHAKIAEHAQSFCRCAGMDRDGVPHAHALLVWRKCSRRLSELHTGFTDFSFFRYFSHGST